LFHPPSKKDEEDGKTEEEFIDRLSEIQTALEALNTEATELS
jgi:hypothetical protein